LTTEAALVIEDVRKEFKLYADKQHSLKERVIRIGRNPYTRFEALKGVSFDVAEGETMGLLGHNGSGKSTLLKCVAGTLRPTSGRIRSRGRVAALLELGAGFHPDLTGRENVYLNGSILGINKATVDQIFDEIVAFAEIEQFIDNQVKYYSSGMYARLAFAVAVNVEPDILLVDEVLSVGDEAFQRKCLDRVKRFQKEGRTILVVTHAADLVRQVCDRAVVLDHGELVTVGAPGDAVRVFRETLLRGGIEVPPEAMETPEEMVTRHVGITSITVEYPDPERPYVLPGEPLRLRVGYDAVRRTDEVVFDLQVHDQDGNLLLATDTDLVGCYLNPLEGRGEVVFEFDQVPLQGGIYPLTFDVRSRDGGTIHAHREQLDRFEVMQRAGGNGRVHFPVRAHWLGEADPPAVPSARSATG
jgi:ABC-2 type transport system ATP-binding protein